MGSVRRFVFGDVGLYTNALLFTVHICHVEYLSFFLQENFERL
jgi:hypothetical protein